MILNCSLLHLKQHYVIIIINPAWSHFDCHIKTHVFAFHVSFHAVRIKLFT